MNIIPCYRLFLGLLLWCIPLLAAAQAVTLHMHRQSTTHDIVWFGSVLQVGPSRPLQSATLGESLPIRPRSHVRITYQSADPLPVRIVFPHAAADYQLVAVLPASNAGEVLLPLTNSPAWRQTVGALDIEIYWVGDTPPTLTGITTENRLSWVTTLLVYGRQMFQPEFFSSFSLGTIYGYRIAGYSLTTVLGTALVILTLGLCVWQRRYPTLLMIATIWVPAMLIYETRFLADIVIAMVSDQIEWRSQGSYSDMRYLYAEAEELLQEQKTAEHPLTVASCTGLATPLRYAVYPIPVAADDSAWKSASHAVVQGVWNADETTFSCHEIQRTGSVIRSYPNGEAIIRFHQKP